MRDTVDLHTNLSTKAGWTRAPVGAPQWGTTSLDDPLYWGTHDAGPSSGGYRFQTRPTPSGGYFSRRAPWSNPPAVIDEGSPAKG